MIGPSTYVGFGKCLNDLLLLGRDRKLSESCGIPTNVLDIGNGKLGCARYQPGGSPRPSAMRKMLLTPQLIAVTEAWYSRATKDQVLFLHLSRSVPLLLI